MPVVFKVVELVRVGVCCCWGGGGVGNLWFEHVEVLEFGLLMCKIRVFYYCHFL